MSRATSDQARHWYQQAIGTGHPDQAPKAMFNLGNLERVQGNFDQARHWYQQAIDTGHPEITSKSQQELRSFDRYERDRQRAEQFGRFGYLAYADPALMRRDDQASKTPGPIVADHPSEPDASSNDDDCAN